MFGVEALPLVHAFSRSENPAERAVFFRVYLDLIAERARCNASVPRDWSDALQACLEKASPIECEGYLAHLDKVYPDRRAAAQKAAATRIGFATRDDIDVILGQGGLDEVLRLAADRKARLRPEQFETLVTRAQSLALTGDRRLVDALLSRDLIRLDAAPLFLEATSEQRTAILIAAQRAVLGRRPVGAAASLDDETAGRLEYAAIAGGAREFADALGAALGCDGALAARISSDPTGEPLAVALIAVGAPRDVCVRVVTARDMQDNAGYPRIQTLARLSERVSRAAARLILEALLGRPSLPRELPSVTAAAPRAAAHPSPFLRRDTTRVAASPETSVRWARGSRKP